MSKTAPYTSAPRCLHGKTLFITGASHGIGLANAKRTAAGVKPDGPAQD